MECSLGAVASLGLYALLYKLIMPHLTLVWRQRLTYSAPQRPSNAKILYPGERVTDPYGIMFNVQKQKVQQLTLIQVPQLAYSARIIRNLTPGTWREGHAKFRHCL